MISLLWWSRGGHHWRATVKMSLVLSTNITESFRYPKLLLFLLVPIGNDLNVRIRNCNFPGCRLQRMNPRGRLAGSPWTGFWWTVKWKIHKHFLDRIKNQRKITFSFRAIKSRKDFGHHLQLPTGWVAPPVDDGTDSETFDTNNDNWRIPSILLILLRRSSSLLPTAKVEFVQKRLRIRQCSFSISQTSGYPPALNGHWPFACSLSLSVVHCKDLSVI